MKINRNVLAVEIAKREGLKEQLDIAQIKEVLKYAEREYKKIIMEATMKETIDFFRKIK